MNGKPSVGLSGAAGASSNRLTKIIGAYDIRAKVSGLGPRTIRHLVVLAALALLHPPPAGLLPWAPH